MIEESAGYRPVEEAVVLQNAPDRGSSARAGFQAFRSAEEARSLSRGTRGRRFEGLLASFNGCYRAVLRRKRWAPCADGQCWSIDGRGLRPGRRDVNRRRVLRRECGKRHGALETILLMPVTGDRAVVVLELGGWRRCSVRPTVCGRAIMRMHAIVVLMFMIVTVVILCE